MTTAISRKKVSIYIVEADTNAADLVASDKIEGEIKNYSKSGGEEDVESDPVFGGFVDKEKPAEQVELGFEIIPNLENADRWSAMAYSLDTATGAYTMASETSTLKTKKAVFIDATDATAGSKSWGFNNCSVIVLDTDHSADDNQEQNMTLKFSPTTGSGVSNFMTKGTVVTSLPAWTALDNN